MNSVFISKIKGISIDKFDKNVRDTNLNMIYFLSIFSLDMVRFWYPTHTNTQTHQHQINEEKINIRVGTMKQ